MGSASDPPAHPARNLPAGSSYRLNKPPAAVETSIGPPHYPAECTHSHASVQPSLRARTGHANSDSFSSVFFCPARVPRGAQVTIELWVSREVPLELLSYTIEIACNSDLNGGFGVRAPAPQSI